MKSIYRYIEEYSKNLEQKLKELKIKYEIKNFLDDERIIFKVNESIHNQLLSFVKTKPLIFKEYTKKELEEADYLQMIPESQKISINNLEECFQEGCVIIDENNIKRTYHKKQIKDISILNIPKDSYYFYSVDTGFSEIFAKKIIVELISKNNLTGFNMRPVYDLKNNKIDNLYQLLANKEIGFNDIKLNGNEIVTNCPVCEKNKRIVVGNDYQLSLKNKKLDEDFYMTEAIFGEGIPCRLYLVSQRFYKLIKKEKMDKKVKFIPVVLN